MKRRAALRSLVWCSPVLLLMPTAAWIGGHAWFANHLVEKTGRHDIKGVTCLYCHLPEHAPPTMGQVPETGYASPLGLAVSPDGTRLYVAASEADRLIEVDLGASRVARSVPVAGGPHSVAVGPDGRTLAVSAYAGSEVHVLDTASLEPVARVQATGARGVAWSPQGDVLWVAAADRDLVERASLAGDTAPVYLATGRDPYAVGVSADGSRLLVVARVARPVEPGQLTGAQITLIDPRSSRVVERREIPSGHLGEGLALSADGSFALTAVMHFRNLLPLTQVARGAVMNSALVYIETRADGRVVQLPLDERNAFHADPSGVVITPDDRLAFVAHGGDDSVSVIDVAAVREIVAETDDPRRLAALADDLDITSRYVVARIPVLSNPRGLAVSPDGSRVYVAETLADSIAVIDTARLAVVDRILLPGRRDLTAQRLGARVFHDASVTFQSQFSCRSCHPDGHTDGLIWDFEIDGAGKHLLDTRSLRGIKDTAPYKWNGKNPNLATQCGPRFARVLTRSDPFPPDRLADLVAYIQSLPLPPRSVAPDLTAAAERGRQIFFRTVDNRGQAIPRGKQCATCHRPPLYTDRLKADVGTDGVFDDPQLSDLRGSPPYLHDGRALTLEEIWTVHSPTDTHGVTTDLTKPELNDLVIFLRSL